MNEWLQVNHTLNGDDVAGVKVVVLLAGILQAELRVVAAEVGVSPQPEAVGTVFERVDGAVVLAHMLRREMPF
jgi:hypothetical protein